MSTILTAERVAELHESFKAIGADQCAECKYAPGTNPDCYSCYIEHHTNLLFNSHEALRSERDALVQLVKPETRNAEIETLRSQLSQAQADLSSERMRLVTELAEAKGRISHLDAVVTCQDEIRADLQRGLAAARAVADHMRKIRFGVAGGQWLDEAAELYRAYDAAKGDNQ